MKKLKITLILILIFFGVWIVNYTINSWYFRNYNYLDQNPHSENLDFKIKRISRNSIEFQFNTLKDESVILDVNGAQIIDTLSNENDYVGWVYLDTLKQNYYFKELYYKQLPKRSNDDFTDWEEIHQWITLNKEGEQINSSINDSLMPPSTAILLKDEKGYFPDWKNKKSVAYVNYFAHEEFNWGILNPFKGMGNPTGGTKSPYWYGHTYYTVNHAKEKIKFKAIAKSYGGNDYGSDISFSLTPKRFKNIPLITFIIVDKNLEKSGLFIVVKK